MRRSASSVSLVQNVFITHVRNERIERVALSGIVVENTRGQIAANRRNFKSFARGVSHKAGRGNKCAKGNEGCFESEGIDLDEVRSGVGVDNDIDMQRAEEEWLFTADRGKEREAQGAISKGGVVPKWKGIETTEWKAVGDRNEGVRH